MANTLPVTVVFSSKPREVHCIELQMAQGATVQQALAASHFFDCADIELTNSLVLGLWGRKTTPHTVLRARDRVEIYRPLTVDPKVARRERFNKQGAGSAGLFKQRRPGAKPGY